MKQEDKEYITRTLKGAIPNLIFILLLWTLILLGVTLPYILAIIMLFVVAADLWNNPEPSLYRIGKKLIVTALFLGGIYLLNRWLGGYGILGLVLLSIVLGVIILIRRWSFYLETLRTLERRLWGETMEEVRSRRKTK